MVTELNQINIRENPFRQEAVRNFMRGYSTKTFQKIGEQRGGTEEIENDFAKKSS
jgi:hypothetical protein